MTALISIQHLLNIKYDLNYSIRIYCGPKSYSIKKLYYGSDLYQDR